MSAIKLSPEQWSRVLEFLRRQPGLCVGQEADCKRFIEAIMWMSRSGAQWRLLPSEYGKWNSVYKRFARWCQTGVWERMHQHLVDDPDMEYLIIDSTIVRAHHSAADAPKKTVVKYLKPSIHYKDPRGCRWPRQSLEVYADRRTGARCHSGRDAHIRSDRAYDSRQFRESIIGNGATPVIPPRSNRRELPSYDEYLYRERHSSSVS